MTTPPNAKAVSDARLEEAATRLPDLVAYFDKVDALNGCCGREVQVTLTECVALLRELQARRAADATREPAPGRAAAIERALVTLLRGPGIGGEQIRFPYRNSAERCLACNAPVSVDEYDEAHEHERGCPRAVALRALAMKAGDEPGPASWRRCAECRSAIETVVSTGNVSGPFRRHVLPVLGMIQKALAAHDAAQAQRDPVQAVLAEVAALVANLDGGPIARSTTANARHQIRQNNVRRAAQSVALVLRLDREAAEKGAGT